MRDAKKTATCFLIAAGLESYSNDQRSTMIKAALENRINTVLSSSIGRLFDAVASLLGIADENSYEGECAIKLEKVAVLALRNKLEPVKLSFEVIQQQDSILIDTKSVLKQICRLGTGTDKGVVALGFHYAVADAVLEVCEIIRHRQNINTVALSGGVFQNTVLMERVLELLRGKAFQVYYNSAVPPNDAGISLGQTYIGLGIINKR
jgi:hydrogenase maturation protein HypF